MAVLISSVENQCVMLEWPRLPPWPPSTFFCRVAPINLLPHHRIGPKTQQQNCPTLPTPKVLNLLLLSAPDAYRLAEVVGKWVWVQFNEQPAAEIRQQLAQLGFHWNRERQAWQHPCGQFSLSSPHDPHEKYASYFPADVRAAS